MKIFAISSCLSLFIAGSVSAQEMQHLAFDIGGGFTQSVGPTGRNLDNGWNIGAGVGWNFSPYVGALVQTNFNSMGINNSTLNNLGYPGGDVHVFSATLDPIVHLHPTDALTFMWWAEEGCITSIRSSPRRPSRR